MTDHNHALASPEQRIAALLENVSSYIEQYHGGWVRFVALEGGVLKVKLGGACQGCALTQTTLQGWIAGTVRQFFPEITEVRAV